jgi:hypothetical protein
LGGEKVRFFVIAILVGGLALGGCTRSPNAAKTATAADANGSASTGTDVIETTGVKRAGAAGIDYREITIPAGTTLPIVLETAVGSDTSKIEEPVHARLAQAIKVNGTTALPEGSAVNGVVTDAKRSGKVKGRAHVALRFDSVIPPGDKEQYEIKTSAVGRTAQATKKDDAVKIGAPAIGGAIVGGIFGGKKGAAVGALAGGGAGTAVVLSTRGKEVHLGKGEAIRLKLVEPLTIKVRS